jgi:hypothetical protein
LDQADEIRQVFVDDMGFEPVNPPVGDSLINDEWDVANLLQAYLPDDEPLPEPSPWVSSVNAHFDHFQLAPANFDRDLDPSNLFTSADVLNADNYTAGTIFFTVGCHSGMNFFDDDILAGYEGGELDWPQVLVGQGISLIGNWGYGYGDDAMIAYSEELMLEFARQIGSSTIGNALVEAKREYILNQVVLDSFHEKILMESVFYGLPHWALNTPAESLTSNGVTIDQSTQGSQNGLTVTEYQLSVSPLEPVTIPGRGTYYELNGQTQAVIYRPVQPQASIHLSNVSGEVAHGVLFTGGTYAEADLDGDPSTNDFDPVITMPTWTRSLPEPQFLYEGWDPTKFWRLAQLDLGNGSYEERLVIMTGQFLVDLDETQNSGVTIGTERLYETLNFEIFYETATAEFQPPIIKQVNAGVFTNPGVFISVEVEDPPDRDGVSSGIEKVLVTFTEKEGGTTWENAELTFNSTSELWEGIIPTTETIDFFVQAVDKSGNVGMFTPAAYFTPVEASILGPSIVFLGDPVSFSVLHSLENPAVLWDFGDGFKAAGAAPAEHAFSQPGEHVIVARLVDEAGNLADVSKTIEVISDPQIMVARSTELISDLSSFISDSESLPKSAFDRNADNRRNSLLNKLSEVEMLVEEGEIDEAINKLKNDLLAKMDGCPTEADQNDWISDCDYQYLMRDIISDFIEVLEIFMSYFNE